MNLEKRASKGGRQEAGHKYPYLLRKPRQTDRQMDRWANEQAGRQAGVSG